MNKPWVTINCAMSLDGKIALPNRQQLRLSNEEDMQRVHRLRNKVDAILVGIGTVMMDDPKLLVKKKYVERVSQPLRIVLDSTYRIPHNAAILRNAAPTLIVTTCREEKKGTIEVIKCGPSGSWVDLKKLMAILWERGIRKVMVEGGETVISEFLRQGLVDEMSVFIAPVVIGGTTSPTLAGGTGAQDEKSIKRLKLKKLVKFGDGVLLHFMC